MNDMAPIDPYKPGGIPALANRLGLTRQAVWGWFAPGKQIPATRVLQVERVTGISRHELRPDLYPREDEGAAA